MSNLSGELDRYLTSGAASDMTSARPNGSCGRFIAFAEQEGAEHISTDLFLRWQEAFGQANRQIVGGASGDRSALCPMAARHRSEA